MHNPASCASILMLIAWTGNKTESQNYLGRDAIQAQEQ